MTIRTLTADDMTAHLEEMCDMLIATVAEGAAISFLHPVTPDQARAFWQNEVAPDVSANRRTMFGAVLDGRLVGSVQLITALPPNQPHRAEIAKMMVHPAARRRGLGRALIQAALAHARRIGKTLVTLDTRTDDLAQPLYSSVGFEAAGVIPDFGIDPDGLRLHSTTYMFMRL